MGIESEKNNGNEGSEITQALSDFGFKKGYEFKNIDGEVSSYYQKLKSYIDSESINRQNEQRIFHKDIISDLSHFEQNLDQYSLLLERFGSENKSHIYPDLDGHVNVLMELTTGAIPRDVPSPIVELVGRLESNSYEDVQLAIAEYPGEINNAINDFSDKTTLHRVQTALKNGMYKTVSDALYRYWGRQGKNRFSFIKECEEGGLLTKHFDELSIGRQREERLQIGEKVLIDLFNHERNRHRELGFEL